MSNRARIIILLLVTTLAATWFFSAAQHSYAAPTSAQYRTLLPETNSLYDLGSASKVWEDAYIENLTLSGGLSSYASTTIGNGTQAGGLTISGGATTTGTSVLATTTAILWDKGGQVFNVRAYGATGNGVTDDTTAVTNAVAALNAFVAHTGTTTATLLFPHGGNYVLTPSIQISSSTRIVNEGAITLNPSYTNSGATFKGIFRLGGTSGTDIVDNVEILGGSVYGDAFTDYDDENPTFNANDHKYVTYVHSVATHRNVRVHDVAVTNMGGPVVFEKLGGVTGTPSRSVHVYNIYEERVWAGVQFYCNGDEYSDSSIHDITVKFSYDDAVAVVGTLQGGGSGTAKRIQVYNIRGIKSGQTGAMVKLDATNGLLQDISVYNISGYTTGGNEDLVEISGAVSLQNRNIFLDTLHSQGTWVFGVLGQVNGYGLHINNFSLEAKYNIHLQGNQTPSRYMNIKISDGDILNQNSFSGDGDDGGYGISFSASTGAQGFANVDVSKVSFLNKREPIYEGATVPSGTGVQGTYTNFAYDVDFGDAPIASSTFSATNSRLTYSNLGLYRKTAPIRIQDAFGSTAPLFQIASTTSSDSTASTTLLTVTNKGYLGVGTTSPYKMLSIAGDAIASSYTATSTTASTLPYASTTALTASGTGFLGLLSATQTSGTSTIAAGQGFTVGSTQFVVQQTSGNVGIGTGAPGAKLDLVGDVRLNSSGRINFRDGGVNTSEYIYSSSGSGDVESAARNSISFLADNDSNGNGNFVVKTRTQTQFTVLSSGFVGIGTTTPIVPFQVATSSANATTSVEIGKASQSKGSCLVLYDAVGTVQYVSIQGGVFVISATTCK